MKNRAKELKKLEKEKAAQEAELEHLLRKEQEQFLGKVTKKNLPSKRFPVESPTQRSKDSSNSRKSSKKDPEDPPSSSDSEPEYPTDKPDEDNSPSDSSSSLEEDKSSDDELKPRRKKQH